MDALDTNVHTQTDHNLAFVVEKSHWNLQFICGHLVRNTYASDFEGYTPLIVIYSLSQDLQSREFQPMLGPGITKVKKSIGSAGEGSQPERVMMCDNGLREE